MSLDSTPAKTGPPRHLPSHAAPVIECAPLPMVEVQGPTHLISYVNAAFARLIGKPGPDLIGLPFSEVIPHGDACLPILNQVYQTSEALTHILEEDKDLEPAQWLFAMWPILDAGDRPTGVVIQLNRSPHSRHNMTAINEALLLSGLRQHELTENAMNLNEQLREQIAERIQAEDALRLSEQRVSRILASITDSFYVIDADWHLTDLNAAARRTFYTQGLNPESLLGMHFWQEAFANTVGTPLEHEFRAAMKERIAREFEYFYPAWNRWYAVRVYPIEEGGIAIYFQDITERHLAVVERELLLQREQLARDDAEAANRAKDIFLATLSHEIRTPLNAILGWATILGAKDVTPDDFREGLEVIDRNCRVQAQLIEDLLDVSRIVSGKLLLDIQPHALADLIKAAVNTLRPAVDAKKIQLSVTLDPVPAEIACDGARIQQVLWNLLNNAVKFTPNGGHVVVALTHFSSTARITVTDSGQGIPPDFLPYVFDRFRQADTGTRRKLGGLGLGLSIVKHIVELHGGTVAVHSAGEGRGSSFTVLLPTLAAGTLTASRDRATPASSNPLLSPKASGERHTLPPAATPAPGKRQLAGVRILVVDDEPDGRRAFKRVLEQEGASVIACASAIDAFKALSVQPRYAPHVLISDIGMPDMDGYDLIREVRRAEVAHNHPPIPAIAVTGFAHASDARRALDAGFQRHIPKPVDPLQMIEIIASLAAQHSEPPLPPL